MTQRLEDEARLWRTKGYERVAQAIDLAHALAKDARAPYTFETNPYSPSDFGKKIAEVLSGDIGDSENPVLDLAINFNRTLGAYLPDSTRIEELLVDSLKRIPNDMRKRVNPKLKSYYSRALHRLWHPMLERRFPQPSVTVGDVRAMSLQEILSLRECGEKSATFLYNAFIRPPQSEQK